MGKIFLLGGYDLEMLEIKQLLQQHQNNTDDIIEIADLQLSWGAKLSSYKTFLDKAESYTTIYGIELIEDIAIPANYITIDHHNELANRPASIIQLSKILNIELNRWQQLVAANDSGYIPAMLAMGATESEIANIRKADRQAQGVSEADEQQAKIDVQNGYWQKDVFVVETKLNHFSPITDRIWKHTKKIVFNKTEVNYYGENKPLLVAHFEKMIKLNKAYHGGGEIGYFGFCDYSEKSAFYVNKVIELVADG